MVLGRESKRKSPSRATADPSILTDRVASTVSRAITRRRFLQRAARAGLWFGLAAFAPATMFPSRADAAVCGPGGHVPTWGCSCASTMSCPSANCSNGNCHNIRKRCTYWTSANSQGNYCWCSQTCCNACDAKGYYTCCDCWEGTGTGCSSSLGQSPCICKLYHWVGCCNGDTCCQ